MITNPPPNIIEALYSDVGRIVVNWSMVEQSLDFVMAIVYHDVGGRKVNKQMSRRFSGKIEFLRKSFNKLEPLQPFKSEARVMFETAKRLSRTRHDLCHGSLSKYDFENDSFLFVVMDLKDPYTMHDARDAWLLRQQLVDDAASCERLVGELHSLSTRLMEIFMLDDEDDQFLI